MATCAAVTMVGGMRALGDEPRRVVGLVRAEDPFGLKPGFRSLLARELIRQSVLMAAREHLALGTRDVLLGEPVDPDGALQASVKMTSGREIELVIRRAGAGGPPLLETEIRLARSMYLPNIAELAAKTGPLTELVARELEAAGFEPGPRPGGRPPREPRLTDELAGRLGRMDFASQFAVARALHRDLRAGRSPELEGALVRAYANLGVLTEHHWAPAHKVFKARALLYAQRMVDDDTGSPRALWHRAYARALTGLHADALADLAAAAKLPAAAPGGGAGADDRREVPAWVPLVEAACRFDAEALRAAAEGPESKELALLLRFLAVEDPRTPRMSREAALEVLRSRPACDRVADGISELGGIANLHQSTALALELVERALPGALIDLPGLPAGVAEALEGGDRAAVVRALAEADGPGDDAELPWAALADLERQSEFAAIVRRVVFMRDRWSVPIDEFLAEALPRVEGHPLRPFLALYGAAGPDRPRVLAALRPALDERAGEFDLPQVLPMIDELNAVDPDYGRKHTSIADRIGDAVYPDYKLRMRKYSDETKKKLTDELSVISPHSPLTPTVRLEVNATALQDREAAAWEQQFAKSPAVLTALGSRHLAGGRPDDAERLLKASLAISPESRGQRALAEVYRARGDRERWRETLDAFLEGEDLGLEHARVRVELARDLMARGEYEAARPYAEAAAELYAEWAMLCAVECCEGLGDWEAADAWMARRAGRYDRGHLWYLWCRRTGRGDAEAALAAARAHFRGQEARIGGVMPWEFAPVEILSGDRRKALRLLTEAFEAERNSLQGLLAAALADELGEEAQRDRLLAAIAARAEEPAPGYEPGSYAAMARLAAWMRGVLAGGEADLEALDRQLASAPGFIGGLLPYFAGQFLVRYGHAGAGWGYLRACASTPHEDETLRTLAAVALRDGGPEPGRGADPD